MSMELRNVNFRPVNVEEAWESLDKVATQLTEQRDPRAVFPRIYGIITRRVKETVADTGHPLFLEPQWISCLAGRFCERYLASLVDSMAGRSCCGEAWCIAYRAAAVKGLPARDAALGINAHINFDLAQGLYDNIVAHQAANDPVLLGRYHHDHDAVNAILEASVPEILDVLVEEYGCQSARIAGRGRTLRQWTIAMVMWMVRGWRSRVWDDLTSLLRATSQPERSRVLARMDRRSSRIGRLLCLGFLHGLLRGRTERRPPLAPRTAA